MPSLKNINDPDRRKYTMRWGKVIERVDYLHGGIQCDIYFSKKSFEFHAKVGQESFSSANGSEVKKWALAALKDMTDIVWKPVIFVYDSSEGKGTYNYNGRELQRHSIELDICRYYVAQLPNGGVAQAEWECEPSQRNLSIHVWNWPRKKGGESIDINDIPLSEGNFHVLPYKEETWNALNQVCKGIDDLSEKIHELVGSDEGRNRLSLIGERMLLMSDTSNTKQLK